MSVFTWLFGGDKKTYVSSSVYNMAGDEDLRPDYLKILVIQNVLGNSKASISDSLNSGYLHGPGIGFRSFFRWADNHYNLIGMPTGSLKSNASIDLNIVANFIPHEPDETVWVQEGDSASANYGRWIEQWLIENAPEELDNNWTADIDEATNDITITFEDESTHTFTPVDFDKTASYIYVYYSLTKGEQEQALHTGTTYYLPFPSTTGWTLKNHITDARSANLVETITTVKTYSDSTPPNTNITTNNSTEAYTYEEFNYEKDTYLGSDTIDNVEVIKKFRQYMYFFKDKLIVTDTNVDVSSEVIGGITVTTTVTTDTESIIDDNSYRIDNRDIYINSWSPIRMFIYRIGSGIPELDDSIQFEESYGKFFPFLPIRLDNKFISNSFLPDAYTLVKKAYKKVTRAKLDKLVNSLSENPDIGDIDYAFIVFGVSLNVKETACQKYLYDFFTKLMNSQVGGPSIYTDWINSRNRVTSSAQAWTLWHNAQSNPSDPLYGTAEPSTADVPNPTSTSNEIRIMNTGPLSINYDIRIIWNYISQGAGIGLGKPGVKKGDYWFQYMGFDELATNLTTFPKASVNPISTVKVEKIRLVYQETETSHIYLDITGLSHVNYVYNGKAVETSGRQAIEDPKESGFIVPLQYELFKNMSLVQSTQMTTACCFIVFNAYEEVTKPWWQSGFFQILLIVGIAVLSVVFTGGAGLGILGANLAVGSALGFTGLTAAIIGSVANALAAVVLTTIIGELSKFIFGEQIGAIIGIIVSFFAMQSISAFQNTGSFALNWGDLMKVDNLMMIMDAAGQGYTAYVIGDINRINAEMVTYQNKAQEDLERIQKQYYDEFGYGISVIDPMKLIESSKLILESGDTFLKRTLMTGSDISAMSMDMLTNFSSLTLTLPNAYS